MKKKKNRKGITRDVTYCPYCGSRTELRSADGIYHDNKDDTMLYVCKNYPRCDTYVRVIPGTTQPMGTLANGPLRALRIEAHRSFDQLYTSGIMTRSEAYQWLSDMIGLPLKKAHIGDMGEYYCRLVIEESGKLVKAQKGKKYGRYVMRSRGGHRHETNTAAAMCG